MLLAGAAALTNVAAAAAAGGLSVTPAILEQTARSGASGTVTIANTSSRKLKVTVRARPWRQARSGAVAADRRRTLSRYTTVRAGSFTLAPGVSRAVSVRLRRVPSRKSLYGSLDVVGKPVRKRSGINVAYRSSAACASTRAPARGAIALKPGSAHVARSSSRCRCATAATRSTRSAAPSACPGRAAGAAATIAGVKILPGKGVRLPLLSIAGLRAGRYTASVTLTQAGRNRVRWRREFRITTGLT